jgi:hypothetical protein
MFRISAILLFIVLPAGLACALDFTPRYRLENADGILIRRPYFSDGEKGYAFRLGADTELTAENGGALFKFTKFTYATLTWRMSSFTTAAPFDATNLPKYQEAAIRMLPKGCERVKIESEEDNVYPMNNWICHRYTISYAFYGFAMRDTVTFLNVTEKDQCVIQVSSRLQDYKAIEKQSWDIIRSWHLIEPELEKRYN